MQPRVALLICIVFIFVVFLRDIRKNSSLSIGLWVPLIWFTIFLSRTVDQWLHLNNAVESIGAVAMEEGSATDRIVFSMLIAAGIFILAKRNVRWSEILGANAWIIIWFLYCGMSILWSDFPGLAFKRWNKGVGALIMVMIILTEEEPYEAIKAIIRRSSYVLIPLSVLLIKYYPEIGVGYSPWGEGKYFMGITQNKNHLGRLCLLSSLFYLISLVGLWHNRKELTDKKELIIYFIYLFLTTWLLFKSNSQTSLVVFMIGVIVFSCLGMQIVKNNIARVGMLFSFTIIVMIPILVFGLGETLIESLGRDITLTGRTDVWQDVIRFSTSPVLGVGYDSFWLGQRLRILWDIYWWRPTEAHNGYLEIYLELGIVGLLLLVCLIISTFKKIKSSFLVDFNYGQVRMTYLVMFLVYNLTESAIKGINVMWFVFLLIAIQIPRSNKVYPM